MELGMLVEFVELLKSESKIKTFPSSEHKHTSSLQKEVKSQQKHLCVKKGQVRLIKTV